MKAREIVVVKLVLCYSLCFILQLHALQNVDFDTLLKQAAKNSLLIDMAKLDTSISKAKKDEVGAKDFPSLSVSLNSEYDDTDIGDSGVTNINDTVLSSQKIYQHSATLFLNYELFSFGAQTAMKNISILDTKISEIQEEIVFKELALKLLDSYVKGLNFQNDLLKYKELKTIYHKMYQTQKDLFVAGEVSKLDLAESAIKVVDADQKIVQAENYFIKILQQLSQLSHKELSSDSKLLALKLNSKHDLEYEHSIEHQKWNIEIEKKHEELSEARRSLAPKFRLYSKYNYYGSDSDHLDKAMSEVNPTGYSIGLSVTWTLFEGFKYNATSERLSLELAKLRLQDKDSKEAFIQEKKRLNRDIYNAYTESQSQEKSLGEQEGKNDLVSIYRDRALVGTIFSLQAKADLVEKSYQQKKLLIDKDAALKKLDYLNPRRLYKEDK